jgi:hypothetical protein
MIKTCGLEKNSWDLCICSHYGDILLAPLAVHVNDIILAADYNKKLNILQSFRASKRTVNIVGKMWSFLGINIYILHEGIHLNQETYIKS